MNLCCLLILCLLGPNDAQRPILASELKHLGPGSVRIIGKFSSLVGDQLQVDETEIPLVLNSGRIPDVLQDYNVHEYYLDIQGHWDPRRRQVRVESVRQGGTMAELLTALRQDLEQLDAGRLRSRLDWTLKQDASEADLATLRLELFSALVDRIYASVEANQRFATLSQLLLSTQPLLSEARGWHGEVLRFANAYESHPSLKEVLQQLRYFKSSQGWTRESDYLRELGLKRVGDQVLTLEQAQLRRALRDYRARREMKALIRSLPDSRYREYAKDRRLLKGMNRVEALTAWGYPNRVTWHLDNKERFEGWFYEEKTIFFLDGLIVVFDSE